MYKFHCYFLFILLGILDHSVNAQSCQCDFTITQAGNYSPNEINAKPGQTICLQAGQYSDIRFSNFSGTPEKPIKLINCGGLVSVKGYANGMLFSNCQYFKLTGTGDSALKYGISVESEASNSMGIKVTDKSSDCEIDHVEVHNVGFAGMMIKTDPSCDGSTWKDQFTMYNVKIHDNYIHNTGGEGLYIGSSFWNYGQNIICSGTPQVVFPHSIVGLEIHHNIVENTGAEGIQYGCSPNAKVHHNRVSKTGHTPFADFQNNGIQVGGGSGGECYNNSVENIPGVGIIMIGGLGNQMIYNNLIISTGNSGIFSDTRPGSLENTYVRIANNTIINTQTESIKIYSLIQNYHVVNNALINPATKKYINTPDGVQFIEEYNFKSLNISDALFQDTFNNNYQPRPSSPLFKKGKNLTSWNIKTDLNDTLRLKENFDIGCYEYTDLGNDDGFGSLEILQLYPNPSNKTINIQLPINEQFVLIDVFNSLGGLVLQNEIIPLNNNLYQIDISTLPIGAYYIKLTQNTGATNSRPPIFQGKFYKF